MRASLLFSKWLPTHIPTRVALRNPTRPHLLPSTPPRSQLARRNFCLPATMPQELPQERTPSETPGESKDLQGMAPSPKRKWVSRGEWDREVKKSRRGGGEAPYDSRDRIVRKPKENPFTAEEIAAEQRKPKKKVAVLLGYSGTGYRGLQINNDEKTIEGDVMKAFIAAGAISKANADDPRKSSLVRCARTDKGVHAAGNVLSLKLIVGDDDMVDKINSHLPPQIRVWGIQRTNKGFSCYQACDSRWYEYLLPSYSLLPPHPDSFVGRKIAEFAGDKGMVDEIKAKNADVGDFWEHVDETLIKPILEKLDPETRAAVLERTRSSIEVGLPEGAVENEAELRASEKSSRQRSTTAPAQQPAPSDAAAEGRNGAEGAQSTTAADATGDADAATSTEPAQRELGPSDFALRDIKLAYLGAKRRYRISESRLDRLQEALDCYVGTNNFHNYTVQKSFKDPSSKRLMKSFVVNREPIIIGDTEWLSLKVHGQSFMMHQIRKMVGLATLVTRCGTDPGIIKETYGPSRIAIPKAPALGLLLERPVFTSYNAKAKNALEREDIDFAKFDDSIEPFKREHIYTRIFEHEEREHTFHSFYHQIDNFKSDFFLWITPGGISAAQLRTGVTEDEEQKEFDRQVGDEDPADVNPEEGEG